MGGNFVRTESFSTRVARLVWTRDSTEYAITSPSSPSYLLIRPSTGRQITLSPPFEEEVNPILLDGWLHPLQKRVVHVPMYFPVLLVFSPEDTTGVVHPTPDYGRPRPKAKVEKQGRVVRAPSTFFQRNSVLRSGILSVLISPRSNHLEFDLYDAKDLKYKHSVQLPLEPTDAIYVPRTDTDIVATVREATVNIYEVQTLK